MARRDNRRPRLRRLVDRRDPRTQFFLVVCEGSKTETLYFDNFTGRGVEVVPVGTGKNTLTLIEEAVRIREEKSDRLRRERGSNFVECWCVFDRDSFPKDHFNNAVRKGEREGFRIAYSNQSFELWFVLHFQLVESALDRSQYCDMMSDKLGRKYDKAEQIYPAIAPLQETAIRNATRLSAKYLDEPPEQRDPSTTVHILVGRLQQARNA